MIELLLLQGLEDEDVMVPPLVPQTNEQDINDPANLKVAPVGVPGIEAIIAKVKSNKQATLLNSILHTIWKYVENATDGGEKSEDRRKAIDAHVALVELMHQKGWIHKYIDGLDDTLPEHLKENFIPDNVSPEEQPSLPKAGRTPVTVSTLQNDKKQAILSSRFPASLPYVGIGDKTCVKLKVNEVKRTVNEDVIKSIPQDALFLLIDAVETGTFNKVEITKEELEAAAPGYAGRMLIEAHEWNDPSRAIGQVLKAFVEFDPQKEKWVMRTLVVVLKRSAVENFERGLYKFVSIGATMKAICSVCNKTAQEGCSHVKGRIYETPKGKIECKHVAVDLQMEELSVVNVPACRPAAVIGKVTAQEAREMLAAALSKGINADMMTVDDIMQLQEIILCDQNKPEEELHMAEWQTEFRLADAQGYNSLLQQAEQYPALSKTFGDLLSHKKLSNETDKETLLYAHELLHRWFNQPTRAKSWTEADIVKQHDEIVTKLINLNAEHPSISPMDAVLHAKSKISEKDACPVQEPLPDPLPSDAPKSSLDEQNTSEPGLDINAEPEASPSENISKEEEHAVDSLSEEKNSDKILNEVKVNELSSSQEEGELEGEANCETHAVSLQDATEQTAGYRDGVAKAQAGATKAQGKQSNIGADLAKGADYRKGYQKGYKESEKTKEPDFVKKQISKGGIKMSETAEQVVLQKSKDEGARSGATKDYSTRKAQGEAKAPVKYTDPDAKAMPQGKLGDVASEASHDYDAEKGKAKAEVQYEKPLAAEDGNYGRMKCPKCNQGNIMADSKKCPNCGASQSELVPMAEDKRMGDFPINKTHSAYDTPPMDAKVQGEGTAPSMEKSKMAADTTEAIKNSQNNNDELRLVKEHLRDMAVKFEAEQQTWIGERRELVAAKTELSEKLSCALEEIETARLDLSTKNSMYKSLLEENQSLTKKLENFAAAEKNAMVEELVNTKLGLGLITEEEKAIEMASYSEKSVDTLKVLHEDMVKNAKKLSNLVLGKKFGVPVAAPEKVAEKPATTESGKIAKGKAVESCDEACEKAKIDEELAEDPVADKGEIGFANSNDGAIKNSTVFGLITRALNTKKER